MAILAAPDAASIKRRVDYVEFYAREIDARPRSDRPWQSACCPFHHERRPSFRWNQNTGAWRCFVCDEAGDVFGFVIRLHGGGFAEALDYVKRYYT